VLYHHTFLNHTFSFAAGRNPLVTAVATAPEGAATAYPGDSSSKRKNNHL